MKINNEQIPLAYDLVESMKLQLIEYRVQCITIEYATM